MCDFSCTFCGLEGDKSYTAHDFVFPDTSNYIYMLDIINVTYLLIIVSAVFCDINIHHYVQVACYIPRLLLS